MAAYLIKKDKELFVVEVFARWHCITKDFNDSSEIVEQVFILDNSLTFLGEYHRTIRTVFDKVGKSYRLHETRIV